MADESGAGITFISINTQMLLVLLADSSWKPTEQVRALLSTLGGNNVNVAVAVPIIHEFLQKVWSKFIATNNKQNITIAVLNGLVTPHRWGEVEEIAAAFLGIKDRIISKRHQRDYEGAIRRWCEGHFITFPPKQDNVD